LPPNQLEFLPDERIDFRAVVVSSRNEMIFASPKGEWFWNFNKWEKLTSRPVERPPARTPGRTRPKSYASNGTVNNLKKLIGQRGTLDNAVVSLHLAPNLSTSGMTNYFVPVSAPATVAIACAICGAGVTVPSAATAWTCPGCGESGFVRRCPKCSVLIRIGTNVFGKHFKCSRCGKLDSWKTWEKHTATVYDLAATSDIPQVVIADADRRWVDGKILAVTGLGGLMVGQTCRLSFGENAIAVIQAGKDQGNVIAQIPYAEARTLRIGGRGAVTTTSGGGWIGGGFGVKGVVEGAMMAGALNALTTNKSTTIETFINLDAGSRALMMLNTLLTPETLNVRLAPAFARIDAAQRSHSEVLASKQALTSQGAAVTVPSSQPDPIEQLKRLGELRDSGVLTPDEFDAKKTELLTRL
jgi:predicted RNA-binding Zn-ribbon protein involved in translation (DUF1610 family)